MSDPSRVPRYPLSLVPSEYGADDDSDVEMASTYESRTLSMDDIGTSDRQSIYSYTSSVDREFILKDVHGRIINNTNDVRCL